MTRKLKGLGLTLIAVFAMSAAAASSASAAEFHSESGTTFLTGDQVKENVFTVSGGTVKCKVAKFGGTFANATEPTLTIVPSYGSCTAFGQASAVDMNGCHYVFDTPTAVSAPTHYDGAVKVSCPAGQEIVVTVGQPTVQCTVKVGTQNPTGVVDYTNEGTGNTRDVLVTSTATGIVYTSSGGVCGKSGTAGTYTGTVTAKGYSDAAHTEQTGIWVE